MTPALVAAVGDFGYNLFLLLHLLTVAVGAGLAFTAPRINSDARALGGYRTQETTQVAANRFVFPGLLLAGIFGGGMVGFADDELDPLISFEQAWLTAAGILWVISLVLSLLCYPPQRFNVFNATEERRRSMVPWLHLTLVALFVDMIWKDSLF